MIIYLFFIFSFCLVRGPFRNFAGIFGPITAKSNQRHDGPREKIVGPIGKPRPIFRILLSIGNEILLQIAGTNVARRRDPNGTKNGFYQFID